MRTKNQFDFKDHENVWKILKNEKLVAAINYIRPKAVV